MTVLKVDFPYHGSPFSRGNERERKIAAILSAAAARFNILGVRGSRLEDIAADLGLTKTGISYYFASKEELATSVFECSVGWLEDITAAAESAPGGAGARLLGLFDANAAQLAEVMSGHRPHPSLIQELDLLSDEARGPLLERTAVVVKRVDALVSDWIKASGAPMGRSEPATHFIFAVLDWLNAQSDRLKRDQLEALTGAVLGILKHGLSARSGEYAPVSAPTYSTPGDLPQIFDRETRNRMKREAFLKVGSRYFNAYGFDGASLADVAATLGVTRGAFYYHIPDKQDFLDQCLDRSFCAVEGALDEADPRGGLAAINHVIFNLIYRQASGLNELIRPTLKRALPASRRKRYEARLRNISRRLGDWLGDAEESGDAARLDTDVVEPLLAHLIFLNGGYTVTAVHQVTNLRLSEDPLMAASDYCFILQNGLRV